jgi:hypothetical protein
MVPQQFELVENEQERVRIVGRVDAVELTAIARQADVRPMAVLSACAEAEPEAMMAAIWAWSARVRPISVRKAHPKPWQMTTRYGVAEASDHSLNMAVTPGSTSPARAGAAAISNATNTIAK